MRNTFTSDRKQATLYIRRSVFFPLTFGSYYKNGFHFFLKNILYKETIAQVFWFHLFPISNLLGFGFSIFIFCKGLQSESPSGSPTSLDCIDIWVMKTMCNSSEKSLPPNHLNVAQQPAAVWEHWVMKTAEMQTFTSGCAINQWDIDTVFRTLFLYLSFFCSVCVSLSFSPFLVLAQQHVNDAPYHS